MLKINKLSTLSQEEKEAILNRWQLELEGVKKEVFVIIENIKKWGDQSLKEYTSKFDGVTLDNFLVSEEEIDEAYEKIDESVIRSIQDARENISQFHTIQIFDEEKIKVMPGVEVWREWRPIEKVGLYVAGGKAIYPSVVLMMGVPAVLAGCREIIMCTPPNKAGKVPAATLVAANVIGIKKIYKVGGAQAIAAMAYGTKTIPKVDKIYGPGSKYVNAAKMITFGQVAIDLPAGPSEIFVLADSSANPSFIAADILARVENGYDTAAFVITPDENLAQKVRNELNKQIEALPNQEELAAVLKQYGGIYLVDNLWEGVQFVNSYAPSFLEVLVDQEKEEEVTEKIINAARISLGNYSLEAAANYSSGVNQIVPTCGFGRNFGPLSVDHFGKKIQMQKITQDGLERMKNIICDLASMEGCEASRKACELRLKKKK